MYIGLLSKMSIILGDHMFKDNCKVEKICAMMADNFGNGHHSTWNRKMWPVI
jgi:hypothetical protein